MKSGLKRWFSIGQKTQKKSNYAHPPIDSSLKVGSLTREGTDKFIASCPHYTVVAERTHDPTIPESDEYMARYALQRHSSYCEKPCMLDCWDDWFETRRQRFLAEGNTKAHG